MNSIESLLGMVATDALEGGPREHYFDEFKDPNYIFSEPEQHEPYEQIKTDLPPIRIDLELI